MPAEARAIVIVGGGTAGWITAGVLAARLGLNQRDDLTITVVEAPGIPILGVGEGTWPTMRQTLQTMGIAEGEFLHACDATFKQGSQFFGWRESATGQHSYVHPFTPPHRFGEVDLATAWLADPAAGFDEAVCFQTALCRQGLAPKDRTSSDYAGIASYAYHFDAGKVASFLKEHCTSRLGVRHLATGIVGHRLAADGAIAALATRDHGELVADLYVDCSGQHGVLIDRIFHVPLVNCRDVLFVDKALAIQVPYAQPDAPIASVTRASAQSAGWIWDIGLTGRRGVGYVYASAYASPETATATLDAYVRATSGHGLPAAPRSLDINAGYRERFWVANCVAIGVSSGFVEPLEASSIAMIELSANHLAEHLTFERSAMAIEAGRYNRKFGQVWRDAIDFLKLHYALSDRSEPFWEANRAPKSLPQSLQDNLRVWRNRRPIAGDFPHTCQLFGPASYQYILYGMAMGHPPEAHGRARPCAGQVQESLAEVRALATRFTRILGPNRDVIENLRSRPR